MAILSVRAVGTVDAAGEVHAGLEAGIQAQNVDHLGAVQAEALRPGGGR